MKRGELWTLKDVNYAAKARPVVIVQANSDDEMHIIAGKLAKILDIHKNDIEEK